MQVSHAFKVENSETSLHFGIPLRESSALYLTHSLYPPAILKNFILVKDLVKLQSPLKFAARIF